MLFASRVTLDGEPCVSPRGQLPRRAWRANAYWCPLGARPGRAGVLMLRKHVARLASGPFHRLEFAMQSGARASGAVFPALYLVRSERLWPGSPDDGEALFLLHLADRRWLVDRFSDTGQLQFNVRTAAQPDVYLAGTAGHTWESALTAVWNTMSGVLGSFPGLPAGFVPPGVPENVRLLGENAWRALHALCEQVGLAVAYNPLADACSLVRLGDAQPELDTVLGENRFRFASESLGAAGAAPATVRVYFATHYRSFGQERDTETDANWGIVSAAQAIDVPTGLAAALSGTVLPIWDSLPRVLDEDNQPGNEAAMANRAAARAALVVTGALGRSRSVVLPGIETRVLPGGEVRSVVWRAGGENRGTITRIVAHPHLPALAGACGGSGGQENFRQPDLARRSFPNFPRLPNMVRVDDDASAPGTQLAANAGGLFPGFVMRYVAGEMQQLEPCWIVPCALELCDSPNPDDVVRLRQRDCYYSRLSGLETYAGDTRPLYVTEGERWAKRLTGSPAHSLLWQPPDNRLPQWHRSPSVGRSVQVGGASFEGFLHLDGPNTPGVWLLPPPTDGDQKIRWPSAVPPGINSFLYVNARDDDGKCLQMEWVGQGCDFEGYASFGYDCGTLDCHYVLIRKGLVIQVGDLSVQPPAGDSGTVSCEVTPLDPYDPCDEPGPNDIEFTDGTGDFLFVDGTQFEFVG